MLCAKIFIKLYLNIRFNNFLINKYKNLEILMVKHLSYIGSQFLYQLRIFLSQSSSMHLDLQRLSFAKFKYFRKAEISSKLP